MPLKGSLGYPVLLGCKNLGLLKGSLSYQSGKSVVVLFRKIARESQEPREHK